MQRTKAREAPVPRYLSVRDACAYLACGETYLRHQIYTGRIPSYRLGRVHRLRVDDLDAFAESNLYRPGEAV